MQTLPSNMVKAMEEEEVAKRNSTKATWNNNYAEQSNKF